MKIIKLSNNEILLKTLEHSEVNTLFSLIDECRSYLRRWLFWVDLTKSPDDIHNSIDSYTNEYERPFCIIFKNEIVGIISLKKYDQRNSSCEIGYWLAEKFQNNGIMYESCKLLIDYLFNNLNIKRIEISISMENTKSKKIPLKLGFSFEGIKRCAEFVNNNYLDYEIYSLINNN